MLKPSVIALAALGGLLALVGCAPTAPLPDDIGVRLDSASRLQHAVQLCPGERLSRFTVLSDSGKQTSQEAVQWDVTFSEGSFGRFATITVGSLPSGGHEVQNFLGLSKSFTLRYETRFRDGTSRTNSTEWELSGVPTLTGGQWLDTAGHVVQGSSFSSNSC